MTRPSEEYNLVVAHYLPNLQKLTVLKKPEGSVPAIFKELLPIKAELRNGNEYLTFKNVNLPSIDKPTFRLPSTIDLIKCQNCDKELCSKKMQVKELPGKYWMDLIDCWSCHQSEFAVVTERLSFSQDGNEVLPKIGQVLYRGISILLPVADMSPCSCINRTGQFFTLAGAGKETHVKLPIWSLDFYSENTLLPIPSLISLVFMELFEAMESTGSASFLIASPEQNIRLTVLSWNSKFYLSNCEWKNGFVVQSSLDSANELDNVSEMVSFSWNEELLTLLKNDLLSGTLMAEELGLSSPSSQISIIIEK